MEYDKFLRFSSFERVERYRKLCKSDDETLRLYEVNLKTSKAFYPLLSLIETFLRNSIDDAISSRFGPNWLEEQQRKGGFLKKSEAAAIKASKRWEKRTGQKAPPPVTQIAGIRKAKSKLKKRNEILKKARKPLIEVTKGRIIAELTFNFWTLFYRKDGNKYTGGVAVNKCFRYRPKGINFNEINGYLHEIRTLRNRIYHNEPICFNEDCIDFEATLQTRDKIYELLSWMDRDLPAYVRQFDTVETEAKRWNPYKL